MVTKEIFSLIKTYFNTYFLISGYRRFLRPLILFSSLLFGMDFEFAYANSFSLQLVNSNFQPQTRKAVIEFLEGTSKFLPESIKSKVNTAIEVEFERLEGPGDIQEIEMLCNQRPGSSEIKKYELGLTQRPLPFEKAQDSRRIKINSILLSEIVKGPLKARKYNCGHFNFYRLAQATLIHEIGHLVDYRTKSSEKQGFLNISKWISSSENSNVNQLLSPDSYEFYSPAETFAVNLEFFLLDPTYKCRRPLHFSFYQTELGVSPFNNEHCTVNTKVKNEDKNSYLDIDPRRIFQIDYLINDPGEEVESKWGHAMLRLHVCDSKRTQVNYQCTEDLSSHVVVGFQADMGMDFSIIKGLTGAYPVRIHFSSLDETLFRYGRGELRSMRSYPLKLSEPEKFRLVYAIIESYWSYVGRYFFTSNNCAVEVLRLIKATKFIDDRVNKIDTVTPEGLRDELDQLNLLQFHSVGNIQPMRKHGYYFQSDRQKSEKSFEFISTMGEKYGLSFFENLDEMGAEHWAKRREKVLKFLDQLKRKSIDSPSYRKILGTLFLLESFFAQESEKKMIESLKNLDDSEDLERLKSLGSNDHKNSKLGNINPFILRMKYIAKKAYGIPLQSEINSTYWKKDGIELKNEAYQESQNIIKSLLPEEFADLQGNQSNLAFYKSKFLKSIGE